MSRNDKGNPSSLQQDPLAPAGSLRSKYFDAMRTNAYLNQNLVYNYVEFWAAVQTDKAQDKWRVMHYMVMDLDQPDGVFKAENLTKEGDISFIDALRKMATFEGSGAALKTMVPQELTPEKYPADKYPELKAHFFDIEHYRLVGNIEGFFFENRTGMPVPRLEGRVFTEVSLQRSEYARSVAAKEEARSNPHLAAPIEDGVLSDIFNSSSDRSASLDNILKAGQMLACLDSFAVHVGALYLGVQRAVGRDDKLDKLQGLTPEEKKSLQDGISATYYFESRNPLPSLVERLLPEARKQLDAAAALGVHVEPFQKFAAECELYIHLLQASQDLAKFEKDMRVSGGVSADRIVAIKDSVRAAEQKFMGLGGSPEQVDRLKAWVANPNKEAIPAWLPKFIERYYDQRRKVMQKVQQRQNGQGGASTMAAHVKPPIL